MPDVVGSVARFLVVFGVVLALAAVQAGIQLACFMHVREAAGPAWQLPVLGAAVMIAVGIVIFSIWIMTFKWGVS